MAGRGIVYLKGKRVQLQGLEFYTYSKTIAIKNSVVVLQALSS